MRTLFFRVFPTVMILMFLCTIVVFSAYSEGSRPMTYAQWKDRVLNLQRIMFIQHKKGIGLGDCPVYTAPSRQALRFANNRQAVDTEKELYEAGKTEDGWLLVRYDPGNGKIRTGYIPPDKVSGFKSSFSLTVKFDYIPVIAANEIEVTDDPITGKNIFVTITEGESFILLAKYTYNGNWWYIECTIDGKTARGFVDRDVASFYPGNDVADNLSQEPVSLNNIGFPSVSPMNSKQIGEIVINGKEGDTRKNAHKDADADSDKLTVVYPARIYPYYAMRSDSEGNKWFYIFVEEDTIWGWVNGNLVTSVSNATPVEYRYVNENGECFIYTIDQDGGAVLKAYGVLDSEDTPETVSIPSILEGYPLRSIGRFAFNCDEAYFDAAAVKQLVLPEGLISLEPYAMNEARGFTDVFLPTSLINIQIQDAFATEGCTAVFHVADGNPRYAAHDGFLIDKQENALMYAAPSSSDYPLPEVKVFKTLSLHYYQPEQIVFPESTEYIDSFTCYDNTETVSVIIPGSVKTIADEAFYAMITEEFILQEGIGHIGAFAFYDTEITELKIPGSIEWLGYNFCYKDVKLDGQPAKDCRWETEEEYKTRTDG